MTTLDRRGFLRVAAGSALAAMMPGSIRRALAIPPNSPTGTIEDVEHIVVLMQENRSFDHYFGTLRGVRGLGDPRAVRLRDGASVFSQPYGDARIPPFRPDIEDLGAAFIDDLAHDWNTTQQAFNGGHWDGWVGAKGPATMACMTAADIPFHHALANAFTICDAYHCAVLGPTDPNRFYLWTGSCGAHGSGTEAVVDNAEAGYTWTTFPERLERAGISWKIYQDIGAGLDAGNYWGWTADPRTGNFGDNALLYFRQYQDARPGEALFDKARRGTRAAAGEDLFAQLRADAAGGTLPQVSWIVAPEAYSEHPNWPASHGAWFISQVLDALTANPETWSRTALFITYDENDGFFDHVPPPSVPASRAHGLSTVDTTAELFAGNATWRAGPLGLGARVPMLVVSPWSRGGYVNSQVHDHTSIIRFIERRFANSHPQVFESNISAWRRAVCGDLTGAFDFARPNADGPPALSIPMPAPRSLARQAGVTPRSPDENSRSPLQERGTRPSRALPYAPEANGRSAGGAFVLTLGNTGAATCVLQVRAVGGDGPWTYTIEPRRQIVESYQTGNQDYDFSVHGPNGFLRRFKGSFTHDATSTAPFLDAFVDAAAERIRLVVANPAPTTVAIDVRDVYAGAMRTHVIDAGQLVDVSIDTRSALRWYDVIVSVRDAPLRWRLSGRIENGGDGFSDPALGGARVLSDDF